MNTDELTDKKVRAGYEIAPDLADDRKGRFLALIALVLLVPVPSIGVTAAMLLDATEGPVGQGIYFAAKVWLAVFPLLWLLFVQKGKLSWSPARLGGFGVAITLGVVIFAAIIAAFWLLGPQLIDPEMVKAKASETGIDNKWVFFGFAFYTCAINSLLEEYVWRWFVFRQCEKLVGGRIAVLLSAAFFTLHHVLALIAQFDWLTTVLASIGVFIGGAVWSWCYLKYRSVWPGYVSHLIVDVAILLIAWQLIFGF